jgi:CRISPR-associated protein Cas6/Cse3/CasE subtype I-E
VVTSTHAKHKYLPLADWRSRRTWLEQQAAKHGFELVGVHVTPAMRAVETHDGRRFSVDATEFTGILKVTDPDTFAACLLKGLGRVGKAFGLNLLIVQ